MLTIGESPFPAFTVDVLYSAMRLAKPEARLVITASNQSPL
jgi:hypothetical protein